MATTLEKRRRFRALHESGCFVLPNPWDTGSARLLEHLGFAALATTSSGAAWAMGRLDNGVARHVMLNNIRMIVEATDLPVNADFEDGHAEDTSGVGESVRMCVETGVAGLSIEDSTGDPANPLYEIDVAVARLKAARAAIDLAGVDVVLTARAENFFVGVPDLDDTITRLKAYADAGADCLYAPGIGTPEQITAVVSAVAPKPVNLLVSRATETTLPEYAALGVRRISVGGALALVGWDAVAAAATRLVHGSFDGLLSARPAVDMNQLFSG